MSETGRLDSSVAQAILNATHDLTRRDNTGGCLVVFSRTLWKHLDPEVIQIDDVVDVIRRRRFSHPTFRLQLSAG